MHHPVQHSHESTPCIVSGVQKNSLQWSFESGRADHLSKCALYAAEKILQTHIEHPPIAMYYYSTMSWRRRMPWQ